MSSTCPKCLKPINNTFGTCISCATDPLWVKPTPPPASPQDATDAFRLFNPPEAAPSVAVDNGQTYDVLPDGRLCIPESKPPSDSTVSEVLKDTKISSSDWEAQRDAAAEAYAKANNGMVDPAKWYAYVAGADWAIEQGRAEIEQRKQLNELNVQRIFELERELASANQTLKYRDEDIPVLRKTIGKLREEIERLTAELADWKHMHENMGKLVDREQAQIEKLRAELKESKAANTFQLRIQARDQELKDLRKVGLKLDEIQRRYRVLEVERDELRAENAELRLELRDEKHICQGTARKAEKWQAGRDELRAEVERLRAALHSIAANSCCDTCQQAKLVARAALDRK